MTLVFSKAQQQGQTQDCAMGRIMSCTQRNDKPSMSMMTSATKDKSLANAHGMHRIELVIETAAIAFFLGMCRDG